jgi:hypothetical protein
MTTYEIKGSARGVRLQLFVGLSVLRTTEFPITNAGMRKTDFQDALQQAQEWIGQRKFPRWKPDNRA